MSEQATLPVTDLIDLKAIARAHDAANKEALLEHARMGRTVYMSRDGKIVEVSPVEIFARYGLTNSAARRRKSRQHATARGA